MNSLLHRMPAAWHELKGLHTAEEIAQQPRIWRELGQSLQTQQTQIDGFLNDWLAQPEHLVIFTGAGGGFCLNGQLLRGRNGLAGEWGHSALPALLQQKYQLPLWSCACGLTGCLERYVSGSGYSALYRHFGGGGGGTEALLEVPAIEALAEAADPLALKVREMHLDLLAYGLAQLVLIEDPHVIVLGGGLSKLKRLYAQLPEAMARHLFASVQVPVVLPPRFGDAAGTRGAALLALQAAHSA